MLSVKWTLVISSIVEAEYVIGNEANFVRLCNHPIVFFVRLHIVSDLQPHFDDSTIMYLSPFCTCIVGDKYCESQTQFE